MEASGSFPDCAGILPDDIPNSAGLTVPHGPGESCLGATTDQQGNLAASHGSFPTNPFWEVFTKSGQPSGSFFAYRRRVLPQEVGFQGVVVDGNSPAMPDYLLYWDAAGREQRRTPVGGDDGLAGIPYQSSVGGTLIINVSTNATYVSITRFDPLGMRLSQRTVFQTDHYDGRTLFARGVVDVKGLDLIVFDPGDLLGQTTPYAARWYDVDGNPVSEFFGVARPPPVPKQFDEVLRPLIGGGAAIKLGAGWAGVVMSGRAKMDPPPAWLAANDGSDFEIIRQRNGYALTSSDPTQRNVLWLYSPVGNYCGRAMFETAAVSVGSDGTVIGSEGEGGCVRPFWPALLK